MPVCISIGRHQSTTCGVTMSLTPVTWVSGAGHLQHNWACRDIAAPPGQHGEHCHAKQAAWWLLEAQGQPLHCACPVHSLLTPAASFLQPLTSASQQLSMWLGRVRQVTNSVSGHRSLPDSCGVPHAHAARAEALLHNLDSRASLQPGCFDSSSRDSSSSNVTCFVKMAGSSHCQGALLLLHGLSSSESMLPDSAGTKGTTRAHLGAHCVLSCRL